MKIKYGYIMRKVADSYVVVPTGAAVIDFSGVITLNESGALLWRCLESGMNEEELLQSMTKEYDIDEETAKTHISEFLTKIKDADLFE